MFLSFIMHIFARKTKILHTMKSIKYIAALAGAAAMLAGCQKETSSTGTDTPDGPAMLEVTVALPEPVFSKAMNPESTEDNVEITSTISLKLTYGAASDQTQTAELTYSQGYGTAVFYDITEPKLIEAWINGGDLLSDEVSIVAASPAMQALPASIPAYGSSDQFAQNGEIMNPANSESYIRYTATVQLEIPVARIEVSGISHKAHAGVDDVCEFSALNISGVYLDNIYLTPGAAVRSDYDMAANSGDPEYPVLCDAISSDNVFIGTGAGTVWPADGQAYGYNFYPSEQDGSEYLPKLKIYFTGAVSSDPAKPFTNPRYAIVSRYKTAEGAEITRFEPGCIYRITDASLIDDNIQGSESGEEQYAVEVTVVMAEWSLQNISVDWVGGN